MYCFRDLSDKRHTYESHGNMSGYATADGVLSPNPPPYDLLFNL